MPRALRAALIAFISFAGCAPPSQPAESNDPLFNNGGFEAAGLAGWTVNTYLNTNGLAAVPPTSTAQLQLTAGGTNFTNALSNATPQSQPPTSGAAAPTPTLVVQPGVPLWPRFGTTSVVINQDGATAPAGQANHQGANKNVNSILQDTTPTLADVDPTDGKVHVRFVLAPELEAAGHVAAQQPFFFVALRNKSRGNAEFFTDFNFANQPGVPWSSQGVGLTSILYTDWQIFDVVPPDNQFALGDTLEAEIFAAGCDPGAHSGTAYVDGFGAFIPSLAISKTAPTDANLDSNITYNFTVQNNTSGVAPNVVATEVLPPDTTFVSINAPAPAQCTTPAVGQPGTVTCTYGWINPGAAYNFSVTVHAYAPAASGTGTNTASTANTLTDTTQAWTVNQFAGYTVYITNSSNAAVLGEQAVIASNTATRLTLETNWTTSPPVGSTYKLVNPPVVLGTATSAGNGNPGTLADTTQSWRANQWAGYNVDILSGTGSPQQQTIASNTATVLTLIGAWTTAPGNNVGYAITSPVTNVVNGNYSISGPTVSKLLGPKRITKIDANATFADLSVTKSDGVPAVIWGGAASYTITVSNNGPATATNAPVQDTLPAQIASASWTCAAAGGGVCNTASGAGNINTTVTLPASATATFTVTGNIVAGTGLSTITNTATVTAPSGITDPFPSNNASTDQDFVAATLDPVNVTKDPTGLGSGIVTSVPTAIDCGAACSGQSASFADGSTVILYAVAVANNLFAGWGGDCAAAGSALTCTLTMSGTKNVTAKFTTCGNGTLDPGEGCDDGAGNGQTGDKCDSQCRIVTGNPCNATAPGATGNASCESGICDTQGTAAPGVCSAANSCGNGVLEAGEGCDHGGNNGTAGDSCNATCTIVSGNSCNATAPGATGNSSCASGICDTQGTPAPGICSPANSCGNGVLEAGEGCDHGANNGAAGNSCNSTCKIVSGNSCNATAPGATGNSSCASGICDTQGTPAPGVCAAPNVCGNGVLDAGEGCDHGGNDGKPGDSCDATCKIVDGQPCNATAPGATGNASCESSICDTQGTPVPGVCAAPNVCGNGVLEAGEGCDHGADNGKPGDSCDATCKIVNGQACNATAPGAMGNTSCESGICDTTGHAAPGVCAAPSVCGNGVLDAGEGCDHGGNNGAAGDACDGSCKIVTGNACNATPPGATGSASCESGLCNTSGGAPGLCAALNACGNGVLEAGEGCDDGANNGKPGDACDASCKIVTGNACNATAPGATGNGSCESGICDTTGHSAPGVCSPANVCGNGVLDAGEGCDHGGNNGAAGDACDGSCKIVTGNACNATPPGATGDGSCESGLCNTMGGAPGVCVATNSCGNGVLESGEGCDDGVSNGLPGGACDASCKIVTGNACNATAPGATGNASCESGLCNMSGGAPGVCAAANACGNGVLDSSEGCDDGARNGGAGDACDGSCKIVSGNPCNATAPGLSGNASCESGICDTTGHAAPGVCAPANRCGNGVLEADEGCDHGGNDGAAGDSCDAMCKIVSGRPCNTTAPGATGDASCESGMCSSNGQCEPSGSCNVDADCSGGSWCDESMHTCSPKLSNGSPLPSDPPHMSPTLDGSCSSGAAMLTCASGVCDGHDNECGYADGDGPCTPDDGPTVCRSGVCSSDGTCLGGACNIDADCTDPSKPSCDTTTHTCTTRAAGSSGFSGGGFCAVGGAAPSGGGWLAIMLIAALALIVRRARPWEA